MYIIYPLSIKKYHNDFDIFKIIDEFEFNSKVRIPEYDKCYSKEPNREICWDLGTPTKIIGLKYDNRYIINFRYKGVSIVISNENIATSLILRNEWYDQKGNAIDFFWNNKNTKFETSYKNLLYRNDRMLFNLVIDGLQEEDAQILSKKLSEPINKVIEGYVGMNYFISDYKKDENFFEIIKKIFEDIKQNVFQGSEEADIDFYYF